MALDVEEVVDGLMDGEESPSGFKCQILSTSFRARGSSLGCKHELNTGQPWRFGECTALVMCPRDFCYHRLDRFEHRLWLGRSLRR